MYVPVLPRLSAKLCPDPHAPPHFDISPKLQTSALQGAHRPTPTTGARNCITVCSHHLTPKRRHLLSLTQPPRSTPPSAPPRIIKKRNTTPSLIAKPFQPFSPNRRTTPALHVLPAAAAHAKRPSQSNLTHDICTTPPLIPTNNRCSGVSNHPPSTSSTIHSQLLPFFRICSGPQPRRY